MKLLLEGMPNSIMRNLSRWTREWKLSYLSLTKSDTNGTTAPLKLVDIEKMKKDVKRDSCLLDKDSNVITNFVNLLEEHNDLDFIKKEKIP